MGLRMNFKIYPDSRIGRLPKPFQLFALVVRNLSPIKFKFRYKFDGIATAHNLSFINESRFKFALENSTRAGGHDYKIYLRLHQALWCADLARKISKEAAFVELGTGKGFLMSGVLSALEYPSKEDTKQVTYLFDTFVPYKTDFKSNQDYEYGTHPHYADSLQQVQKTFAKFPNTKLIPGRLPESLNNVEINQISFLHIDLNAPEIEIASLKLLWDKILPGGVILIDDYAYAGYDYTYELFNKFAIDFKVSILTTASGQGIILK